MDAMLRSRMMAAVTKNYLTSLRENTRKGDRALHAEALLRCVTELWLEERSREDLAAVLRVLADELSRQG